MYDRAMKHGVRLRPAEDADYAFMRVLYATGRELEKPHFGFSDEQWEQFMDHQFSAQTQHYKAHYPTARFEIIERDGAPIGRLYVDVWESEIRIVDVALMPEARNSGIGSALLHDIFGEARAAEKPVTIHVEAYNPAMHLYQRLGFQAVDTNGAYVLMKWSPDQVNTAS
jgi:ribosomal protein S18 acetylase RimI-like enzyme